MITNNVIQYSTIIYCVIVADCGVLPAPVNGSIEILETTFESVSVFSCEKGFNQSGSSMRECQANGEWSGIDTICTSNKINDCVFL